MLQLKTFCLWRRALIATLSSAAFSQTSLDPMVLQASVGVEVRGIVASVSSGLSLSVWRASHGAERADFTRAKTKNLYEVDYINELCVTSVVKLRTGVTRAASFYVPEVKRGALPKLPAKQDFTLTDSCRLGAVWYEANSRDPIAGIFRELVAAWGPPTQSNSMEIAQQLFIEGSGLWKDVSKWHRGTVTIWLGLTNWPNGDNAGPRTIVWVARDRSRDIDPFVARLNTTLAAAKIARLDPALTSEVAHCSEFGDSTAVERLSRWLDASQSLPPDRRAAALLVADSLARCADLGGAKAESLRSLGAKFEAPSCPQPGVVYSRNFLQQAENLDPNGPAGALAALEDLQSPCSLKSNKKMWMADQVIAQGQKILSRFSAGPWSQWVYFALAHAHEVKLSASFSMGEADTGVIHPLTAEQTRQERNLAIADLTQFIKAQPETNEAVAAWKEAWRLLAGLLPNATYFGCGCE